MSKHALAVLASFVTLAEPLPVWAGQVAGAVIAEYGLYKKGVQEEEVRVDFGASGDEERALREAYRRQIQETMAEKGMTVVFPDDYLETGLHRLQSTSFQLMERTDGVPAKLGTTFGVRFVLSGGTRPGDEPVELTYRVDFPATDPDATQKLQAVAEWGGSAAIGELTFVGWSFTEPWEVVKGEWTLRILYEGKQLAEQRFVVE